MRILFLVLFIGNCFGMEADGPDSDAVAGLLALYEEKTGDEYKSRLKVYRCGHADCSHAFMSEGSRTVHIVATHLEKNVCRYCGKNYASRSGCKDHINIIHGDGLQCGSCDEKFKSRYLLQKHRRSYHKLK